jgi:hypothetical protein
VYVDIHKIEHRNIVAYGGFKKSISGYTRNRMQNPTIKSVEYICIDNSVMETLCVIIKIT